MAGGQVSTANAAVSEALRDCRRAFWSVALLSAVVNLLMLAGPLYMLQIYDRVLSSRSVPTLVALSVFLVGAYAFQGILDLIRTRVVVRSATLLDHHLGGVVHDTVARLAVRSLHPGEATQPVRDLDQIRSFLTGSGPIAIVDLPWMPVFLLICFVIQPWLGLVALVGGIILLAITLLTERASRAPARDLARDGSARASMIEATRRNGETVAAMGMSPALSARWVKANHHYLAAVQKASDVASSHGSVSKIIRLVLQSAILGVGALLVIRGELMPGAMIAASVMMGRALAPLETAIANWRSFINARDSIARLSSTLRQSGTADRPTALPRPSRNLSVEQLTVLAPGGDEGSTRFYQFQPVIDTWTVDATILDVRSIGAGGGSIIRVNAMLGNQVEVGPESAGSHPGPASYNQGGTEPTVTDADVVLGYINPDSFHGGRLALDKGLAAAAIEEKVAKPLGVTVEEAALLAKRVIDARMGNEIYKETVLKGFDPRDFVLFAVGGAGPVHATGFAEAAQLETVVVFPYSSTFCAFGSSTMDVVHLYEKSLHLHLRDLSGKWFDDFKLFNAVVDELTERALNDFRGEGLPTTDVKWQLELDLKFGGQLNTKRTMLPLLRIHKPDDIQAIYKAFEKEYSEAYSAMGLTPEAGVEAENFVLRATITTPKPDIPRHKLGDRDPTPAQTGTRQAYWRHLGWRDTPVYDRNRLKPGHAFEGPGLVEAEDTTVVVEPGWSFLIDEFANGVLRQRKSQQ